MEWLVLMKDSKPRRKPLQERQAMEADVERREKLDPMAYEQDGLQMEEYSPTTDNGIIIYIHFHLSCVYI